MQEQCLSCVHFHGVYKKRDPSCDAFPNGIPEKIWMGDFDHNNPFEADRGIRFEPAIEED